MIVNLKHLKKQFFVLPSFGITYLTISSPNPRKVLHALTAVQLWIQLLSLLLLLTSCLEGWFFSSDSPTKHEKAYFIGSLVFQAFDIIVTVYASYHLRYASSVYNYIPQINTWAMVNNIYLTTSIMCFIYIFSKSRSFVICLRVMTTCLFTVYKVYIVYQMYRNEKSSNIILEQNVVLLESSPKLTNNGNSELSQSKQGSVVVVDLGTITDTPEVKEDMNSIAATTITENKISQ